VITQGKSGVDQSIPREFFQAPRTRKTALIKEGLQKDRRQPAPNHSSKRRREDHNDRDIHQLLARRALRQGF